MSVQPLLGVELSRDYGGCMQLAKLFQEGLRHFDAKRYVQAEKCFRKMLIIDPKNLDALNALGLSLQELGQEDAAADLLT